MNRKRKPLSHAEVWDDSALIDSWNAALQEYKHYHSLHARGEKVEDVIRQAEEADAEDSGPATANNSNNDVLEDGELDADEEFAENDDAEMLENVHFDDSEALPDNPDHAAHLVDNITNADAAQASQAPQSPGIALPGHLAVGMENEALKNLMMSWYYAGYYTGYYEGQRAGSQQQQPPPTVNQSAWQSTAEEQPRKATNDTAKE